jgi:endonuclease YncB( thermonuclease family)
VFAAAVLWGSAPVVAQGADTAAPGCEPVAAERRTVARVLDGETLQVDGGAEVRLVGALAPRAYDAGAPVDDWPLAGRARAALEALVAGNAVSLSFAGRRQDRYGRLLAQVFVGDGATGAGLVWVQGELLRQGLARAYALEGSTQCLAALIAHERGAREAIAGLWAEPVYAVREAADSAALLQRAGTFQVVEGRVLRAGPVRGALYMNFGEDWRQDFTVLMRDRIARLAANGGLDKGALEGRRIRVRGWIERRGGPLVEVVHPALIEALAEVVTAGEPQPARASRRRSRRRPAAAE